LVHTAPGHGQEDYLTGLKYGLPLLSPVNDMGMFTEEAGERYVYMDMSVITCKYECIYLYVYVYVYVSIYTGLKYGLPLLSLVHDIGMFTEEVEERYVCV
jgi:hypothetical protein